MRRLTYTDPNGISYVLNDDITASLKQGGLRGFGVPRLELATQRVPYQSGVALLGDPYMPSREMRVALDVSKATFGARIAWERALRRNLSPFKASGVLGTLTVEDTDNAVTRAIDCWMTECPDSEYLGPSVSTVFVGFLAPDPWFYDPTARVETLAMSGGGVTFPVTFPVTFGATGINGNIYANNPGDIEAWPLVRIQATGGSNPELENVTTGKTIALTAGAGITLDVGDYIDIDMAEATVEWYDASVYDAEPEPITELLSDESEFWSIITGGNTIHVTMPGATSGSVMLIYKPRYLAA